MKMVLDILNTLALVSIPVMLLLIWRALMGSNRMSFNILKALVKVEQRMSMLERLLRENAVETRQLKETIERQRNEKSGE